MTDTDDVTLGPPQPLGFSWKTTDPFLFCVHHDDAYPKGNGAFGPAAALDGRQIGSDFEGKDGWRMYHGERIPGFPAHPHRGFETVTIVRRGFIDHSDSLGAAARFGGGDVQWLTAGRGIVHSEMFPLLRTDADNPLELFQIWVNLPHAQKMVEPHFSMLWSRDIPEVVLTDDAGRSARVNLIAGHLAGHSAPPPPPNSWAAQPESDFAIWTIKLDPGAQVTLPRVSAGVNRTLYLFRGNEVEVGTRTVPAHHGVALRPGLPAPVVGGPDEAELLLLQGRPIAEPVFQHGPFVMSSREEIVQAFADYQSTHFGGWPWPDEAPVHEPEAGRFARHADGTTLRPK